MTDAVKRSRVLVVDDDRTILRVMAKVLEIDGSIEVYQATSANEGMGIVKEIRPDLIISDYYMPGMDGFEFCRNVKADPELGGTMFLLLSSETAAAKKKEGLECGADDYVEKNTPHEVFLSKVRAFLRIKRLQDALREGQRNLEESKAQLEKDFEELTSILLTILETRMPGTMDKAATSRAMAEYIAVKLGMPEGQKRNLVFAATLREIGLIGLPDDPARKGPTVAMGLKMEVLRQHPSIGSSFTARLSAYGEATEAIRHQFENFNGTGIPKGLMNDEIPIGARVLRAIGLQQELFDRGLPKGDVVEQMKLSMNRQLDPSIATLVVDFLHERSGASNGGPRKRKVSLEELQPGMVIADDVYSSSGTKLLPKGATLYEKTLQLVNDRNMYDPIVGGVYVVID
jgi:putative two-component system response regulator